MTYDVLFLRKETEQSWDEVLRAHQRRIGPAAMLEAIENPMQERFDAVVEAIGSGAGDGIRKAGPGFVALHQPAVGIELHMFATEVSLTARLTAQRALARAAAERMVQLARIVEDETGFRGYDPQIGAELRQLRQPVDRIADEMVRRARTIDQELERGNFPMTWRRWREYSE